MMDLRRRILLSDSAERFTVTIISDKETSPTVRENSFVTYKNVQYCIDESFECKKGDVVLCLLCGAVYGATIYLNNKAVVNSEKGENASYGLKIEGDTTIEVVGTAFTGSKMYITTE